MAINMVTVMQHVRTGNPNFERIKRSSLRPLLAAINSYNQNPGDATCRAVAIQLLALPEAKRTDRYQVLVNYLENLQELKGTVRLEKGRLRLQQNAYRITANLANYRAYFGEDFQEALLRMDQEHIWMDAGAGEAVAMREYVKERGRVRSARCVAVGYKKPESAELRRFEDETEGFRYVSGKFFGEMTDDDLGIKTGSLSLITDFNGVLLYTTTLSQDLERYLQLLRPGGLLFFGRSFAELSKDGKSAEEVDWLQEVSGVKFRMVNQKEGSHYEMIRGEGEIQVPLLEFVADHSDLSSSPPSRYFRWGVF